MIKIEYNDYEVELNKLKDLRKSITSELGFGDEARLRVLGLAIETIDDILEECNAISLLRNKASFEPVIMSKKPE